MKQEIRSMTISHFLAAYSLDKWSIASKSRELYTNSQQSCFRGSCSRAKNLKAIHMSNFGKECLPLLNHLFINLNVNLSHWEWTFWTLNFNDIIEIFTYQKARKYTKLNFFVKVTYIHVILEISSIYWLLLPFTNL